MQCLMFETLQYCFMYSFDSTVTSAANDTSPSTAAQTPVCTRKKVHLHFLK